MAAKGRGYFWSGLGDALGKIYGLEASERMASGAQEARADLAEAKLGFEKEKLSQNMAHKQAMLGEAQKRYNVILGQKRDYEQELAYKTLKDQTDQALKEYQINLNAASMAVRTDEIARYNAAAEVARSKWEDSLSQLESFSAPIRKKHGGLTPAAKPPSEASQLMDLLRPENK